MITSLLIGLVGGQRAMTPLAVVAVAAARGELTSDSGAPKILANSLVAGGALVLAIAEMAGDKLKTAPDRIVPSGLAARFVTSAIAGAALAPRRQRWLTAIGAGLTAVAASYPGWRSRMSAMERSSQARTGFLEDAIVLAGAVSTVRRARDVGP